MQFSGIDCSPSELTEDKQHKISVQVYDDPNSTISLNVALLPLQHTEQQTVSDINDILTK